MPHRPKSILEIYFDSMKVNLEMLEKQLAERGANTIEVDMITRTISELYNVEVERIAKETERDMMAIEQAQSPLELFIDCISKLLSRGDSLSANAASLLQQYVKTLDDWM